ncbi:MAG: ATP-binding cassette domain-containing protein [Deltaproteobacteria bacterium]|nr:ATP-binding cassette domain-containing protein [Deltaproteobacteria bacterium]MBW2393172.1 ATP-binding cassette domain-containing protein [Deltaproteobacteria bacterium]
MDRECPLVSGGTPVVTLEGVRKAFRDVPVLRGVDLTVAKGDTFTILGGSGSGKSVCLKHMIGLLEADAGRVLIEDRDVTHLSERGWVAERKRFGMVFQGAALFDSLSVFENVAYPIREHRNDPEERVRERVRTCLASVGLAGIEELVPAELSGGMRKRVGVARAIALEPAVMLYDEPTTGLDPANARRIGRLIRQLQQELGVTSVVVTHDMELCHAVSDRIALLRGGRIVVEDAAAKLADGRHPEMRAFLEGTHEALPPSIEEQAEEDSSHV